MTERISSGGAAPVPAWLSLLLVCLSLFACSDEPATTTVSEAPPGTVETGDPTDRALAAMMAPIHGDLDELVARRYIRVLVAMSRTHYFLDGAQQGGIAFDSGKLFEEWLNKRLGSGTVKVHVEFLPVSRERMFTLLAEGRGDLAMGNLTVTADRAQFADFATPFLTGANEILVTAADQPAATSIDDLAGREVHVRSSSSYHASLVALNEQLKNAGKEAVRIVAAPDYLEDEDLLEMVDAGMIPATVVDEHIAAMWQEIYSGLRVHSAVRLRENGSIAWAVRKGCPKLLEAVSAFAAQHKKGSLQFNLIHKSALVNAKRLKRSADAAETKKLHAVAPAFRAKGEKYEIPWLLLAALGYQESQLDQKAKSPAGAVGIMQLLPKTAAGPPIEIKNIDSNVDANIEAGAKYLKHIANTYVDDVGMDPLTRSLFVLASYNAGPARIAKLRKKAAAQGLDPDRWFGNVEVVVAKEIGRETVQYVANIYKYYVSYTLVVERMIARGEFEKP